MKPENTPLQVFACEPIHWSTMRFRCPHCGAWHYHRGRGGGRQAHCLTGPLVGGRYEVVEGPPVSRQGRAWATLEPLLSLQENLRVEQRLVAEERETKADLARIAAQMPH